MRNTPPTVEILYTRFRHVDEIPSLGAQSPAMATPGALANIPADHVLDRISNGTVPQQLARELGVHHASIYRLLARLPEAREARKIGMACRLDNAEEAVLTSDERTLPRAREAWRCATWRAEREHPAEWGSKVQGMGQDGAITLEIVRYSAPVTIDQAPAATAQTPLISK